MIKSESFIKKAFTRFLLAIELGAKESEILMIPFGIFGLIAYLIYYLINRFLLPAEAYDSLFLRIIISILCFFLIIKNFWPQKYRRWLPIYWYATILYSFPFFIAFMTLKNHGETAWIMNLLSITILMILLMDWVSYSIVFVLGVFLACSAYYLTSHNPFVYIPGTVSYKDIINTFTISIIMGVIFFRNKEKREIELSANIAHELRTPLAAVNASAEGIKEYFPDLIKTYELAKKSDLPIPQIRASEIVSLNTALDNIKAETYYANTIINMLLVNVNTVSDQFKELEECSIADCIEEALHRYPLHPTERAFIQWEKQDNFIFRGKKLLMIHVIFNLLKNALYYVRSGKNKKIIIWTEKGNKENILYFMDTGKGIAKKDLSRIFDRFFTQTYRGSGMGLAFCKMVLQTWNSTISCESIEGEYTKFILSFPRIDKL
jgi:two-component system CAI-1 autoinducer sensor kinase/phosphatase CqsS